MNKEQLIAALKVEGIDIASLQTQNSSLTQENVSLKKQNQELSAVPAQKDAEIKTLKDKLAVSDKKIVDDAKESVFNKLVAQGKVVPAQKEGVLNTFDSAEKMELFYKDAPVLVNMEEHGAGGEGNDESLSEAEESVVASGRYTREEIIKNRNLAPKKKNVVVKKK